MIVSLIYAQSTNGVIGRENGLPWHLPADLERFKTLTTGHTIIMGRKTYESIGRPLPHRRSVVVSRHGYHAAGVDTYRSLDDALASCANADPDDDDDDDDEDEEVFVIGGSELFRAALPKADRIYRTIVHGEVTGDVTLPELDEAAWTLIASEDRDADERNAYPLSFQRFVRRSA